MKAIVLAFAIVVLVCLGNQCTRYVGVVQSNGPTPSASPSPSLEDDLKRRHIRIIEDAIKHESLKLKIGNLKDTTSKGGNEIRVWVAFGIIVPRIFIHRERNGKHEATYINAKTGSNRVDRNGEIRMARLSLAPPKSGWNEFAAFMKNQGIDSPMKLSLDQRYEPDPDEEGIAIEVKSQGRYALVFYLLSTKSEDGRKALEVCRRIEQEFGILMGCGAR